MPIYHQLGRVPRKRHIVFRDQDGRLLRRGADGQQGLHRPLFARCITCTSRRRSRALRRLRGLDWKPEPERLLKHRHFRTDGARARPERWCSIALPVLFNSDVALLHRQPQAEDDLFYRNAQGDEIIFVSDGERRARDVSSAICRSGSGDYLVIPRGILHRYRFAAGPSRFLFSRAPAISARPSATATSTAS